MKALSRGEGGDLYFTREGGQVVARQYVRDHAGKRRRIRASGATQAAARRALVKRVDEVVEKSARAEHQLTTVATAAREWLAGIEHLAERGMRSPTTVDTYRYHLEASVVPGLGQIDVRRLTTGQVHGFLVGIDRDKGAATAKVCRTILSGTCGLLARSDRIDHNPVRDVGPVEAGRRKAPRSLTVGEVSTLLAAVDASPFARRRDLPDLLRFMLATGVRVGEAVAVRWDDVDLVGGVVVVDHTVIRAKGVGLVRKGTKTEAGDRRLALPAWCVDLLRARRIRRPRDVILFPSARGTWQDRNNVGASIRKVRESAGAAWFVSHVTRRTVATLLDDQGLSARAIADQLGHSRPSMTQDVYMGRRIASQAAATSLDAKLGSVVGRPDESESA